MQAQTVNILDYMDNNMTGWHGDNVDVIGTTIVALQKQMFPFLSHRYYLLCLYYNVNIETFSTLITLYVKIFIFAVFHNLAILS